MSGKFTTFEIAKALNLKYGRLREWIDQGYVHPSVYKAKRQGEKSLFTRADAFAIAIFDYLLTCGFSRKDAALRIKKLPRGDSGLLSWPYAAFFRKKELEGVDAFSFFIEDETFTLSLLGKTADGRAGEFDDVLVVNLKKIRSRVDQALE